MSNILEELTWRGLVQDTIGEIKEHLSNKMVTAYIGFDPTADSLHIGSLVPILLLVHLQKHGHRPIALVGGATGMIGDPSGKSKERNLLDEENLNKNIKGIKNQLERFLDFNSNEPNKALLLNNYDWFKDFSFIDFARDIGKHLTVNYMIAKDSVKKRIQSENNEGMSFTEFTYQLLQGYDFLHLYKNYDCTMQMGGSDQWGNITTGTELIRRIAGGNGFAFTCPLTTKADGTKFGKSEDGENIWLDPIKTSPYKFYQFWLNTTDIDAEKYIKIYTFLPKEEIENLIVQHQEAPHNRLLQKELAKQVTEWVHGKEAFEKAINATNLLFGNSTQEDLFSLDEETFFSVFDGVPKATIPKEKIETGITIIDLLSTESNFLSSKNEAKRALTENSILVNKEKVNETTTISATHLINNKYILLQRGKKKYFVVYVN